MFSTPDRVKKLAIRCLAVLLSVVLLAFGVLAWLRFAPVAVADGWRYVEVQKNLADIVSLARMPEGSIFATLSFKQHKGEKGRGQLIKLDMAAGRYTVLAEGLYKPDGLLPFAGGVVMTQEFSDQPVLFWKDGAIKTLMTVVKPESIVQTPEGHWLVIEDTPGGRLLDIDPVSGKETVLYSGFAAGEGLCIGRDNRIFLVDNKVPDLLEYVDGKIRRIPAAMHGAGFLRCTRDGIWITEDVTNNGHLWFYDYNTFHLIASHLHSPQSVLEDGDSVLVAEQGRSRLLRFSRR